MPSWNIHIAHVERLLGGARPSSLGIADPNAFLFGNLVPDVYVGYMVSEPTRKIAYKDTHFADPSFIPAPDASAFYRRFVRGHAPSDFTLGAWTHLLCDHYYNLRTSEYIHRIGVEPGDETRRRKQADFDLYGRTLDIAQAPVVDDELLRQAAAFPQYAIAAPDVRAAAEVAQRVVARNAAEHVTGTPVYSLLTDAFFSATSAEVDAVLAEALRLHAAGSDAAHLGEL